MLKEFTYFTLVEGHVSSIDLSQFSEQLFDDGFKPAVPLKKINKGWIPPYRGSNLLMYTTGRFIQLTLLIEDRSPPLEAIGDEMRIRIKAEIDAGSKDSESDIADRIKKSVIDSLIERAFPKKKHIDVIIDRLTSKVLVGSTAKARITDIKNLLTKAGLKLSQVTNLDMQPMRLNELTTELPMFDFDIGHNCEIQGDENEKITYKNSTLPNPEVEELIKHYKMSSLQMIWNERILFTLNDDYQVKAIKYLELIGEEIDGQDVESTEDALFLDFEVKTSKLMDMIMHLDRIVRIKK